MITGRVDYSNDSLAAFIFSFLMQMRIITLFELCKQWQKIYDITFISPHQMSNLSKFKIIALTEINLDCVHFHLHMPVVYEILSHPTVKMFRLRKNFTLARMGISSLPHQSTTANFVILLPSNIAHAGNE